MMHRRVALKFFRTAIEIIMKMDQVDYATARYWVTKALDTTIVYRSRRSVLSGARHWISALHESNPVNV